MEKKSRVEFNLMSVDDNRSVLDLINSVPISGDIDVLFSKEPDYIKAMEVSAYKVQPVVGKLDGKIEVLGTRSLKNVYINGETAVLGYLSDLKISPKARKRQALSDGFSFMKTLMVDKEAKLHIATIIEDNRQGKAALTWKNKSLKVPNFYNLGLCYTYFVIPILPKIYVQKYKIVRGSADILGKIVEFLNCEGRRKQFFPRYTEEYFLNLRDFKIEDFYIAMRNNEIVGVLAKWEQSGFKQVVIRHYGGNWRWIKRLTGNLLPKENEPVKQFYLSFIAVKDNNCSIFENLLNHVYNDSREYKYFSLILHSNDGLNGVLKNFIHIKYRSRLYVTEFLSDNEIEGLIDERVPYLELAGL